MPLEDDDITTRTSGPDGEDAAAEVDHDITEGTGRTERTTEGPMDGGAGSDPHATDGGADGGAQI